MTPDKDAKADEPQLELDVPEAEFDDWDVPDKAETLRGYFTLGIMIAIGIAFLAVCVPMFLLNK